MGFFVLKFFVRTEVSGLLRTPWSGCQSFLQAGAPPSAGAPSATGWSGMTTGPAGSGTPARLPKKCLRK